MEGKGVNSPAYALCNGFIDSCLSRLWCVCSCWVCTRVSCFVAWSWLSGRDGKEEKAMGNLLFAGLGL